MNVGELVEMLQDLNPELEVRLAIQPSYPLETSLGKVTLLSEIVPDVTEAGDGDSNEGGANTRKDYVMLLEGSHIGYGLRAAWCCFRHLEGQLWPSRCTHGEP